MPPLKVPVNGRLAGRWSQPSWQPVPHPATSKLNSHSNNVMLELQLESDYANALQSLPGSIRTTHQFH